MDDSLDQTSDHGTGDLVATCALEVGAVEGRNHMEARTRVGETPDVKEIPDSTNFAPPRNHPWCIVLYLSLYSLCQPSLL
jgi:hypothetical protein